MARTTLPPVPVPSQSARDRPFNLPSSIVDPQSFILDSRSSVGEVLLLLAWCGFLFFYGLSVGELYRTESLRAIIAAQFLKSGNWIVPTLYGEPLFTKPPGMYAAIALASWPFGGVSEWTSRLPSALAASLTILLFYDLFRRYLGRLGGLVAAALLPLSFMWLDKASTAEIDMLQVAWVAAAVLCFLRALEAEENKETRRPGDQETQVIALRVTARPGEIDYTLPPPSPTTSSVTLSPGHLVTRSFPWWLAALLCVAGGVLTKWTAPAFFYGTVVPLLWWRGRLRLLWGRGHLLSAGLGAALCLAWVVAAVSLTGWEPFSYTVGREALMRILPNHHHRAYPWAETLTHPLRLWAAAAPCSLFAQWALRPGFARLWDERQRRLLQALHCWIWPNLLFWSIIPEHAPRHSFPLFPAIAGLAVFVWTGWLTGVLRWPLARRLSSAAALLGLVAIWLVVKVAFVHAVVPARNQNREPRAKGELLAQLVPAGQPLYLFALKDEGIMFYYGRPVIRLPGPAQLPSSPEPLYCILDEVEWQHWRTPREAEVVERLKDEQEDPIVLLRLVGLSSPVPVLPAGSRHHEKARP
jgi:4-amino-4-deoxy-L-arabinose transferase-like glycosyltransferase